MYSSSDIKTAISLLHPSELAELKQWFDKYEQERWIASHTMGPDYSSSGMRGGNLGLSVSECRTVWELLFDGTRVDGLYGDSYPAAPTYSGPPPTISSRLGDTSLFAYPQSRSEDGRAPIVYDACTQRANMIYDSGPHGPTTIVTATFDEASKA